MYKNLFWTILWAIGIIGIWLFWTVRATDVVITYDLSGWYWVEDSTTWSKQVQFQTDWSGLVSTTDWRTPSRGDECEENGEMKKCMFDWWYLENWDRWTWYADNDMTVYAKWLPFEDLIITTGDLTLTIMDRNLWATASGTWCSSTGMESCWYHFQWWNNYGFEANTWNKRDFPNNEHTTEYSHKRATDWQWHTSTYYNWIWITQNPRNTWAQVNDNLWWWSKTSNLDIDRQWPCPKWYHVPDNNERNFVLQLLDIWEDWIKLRETLKLPFSSMRYYSDYYFWKCWSFWYYWSSSPYPSYNYSAYSIYFDWNSSRWVRINRTNNRSDWNSVRCFKNSDKWNTLKFLLNNQILSEKNIRRYEPILESYKPNTPERENASFIGWFVDDNNEAFEFGDDSYIFQDTNLIAKYKCNVWYVENEDKTACEKIRVEFDANWWTFWDEHIHIVNSVTNKISSNEKKYSHTANINDDWVASWIYANNLSVNDIVNITWATSLDIEVWFSTDTSDWLAIYPPWITPTSSNYNSATISNWKLKGHGSYSSYAKPEDTDVTYHRNFTATWDTVQFYFYSNSYSSYYGYYAEITEKERYEVVYESDVFDNIPEPTREWHSFKWRYLSDDTEFNTWSISTGEVTYVYAKWECADGYENKWWECIKKSSWSSGWWWGGWSSSSKTDTGSTASGTWNQINSNTWDIASTWTNVKEPETNTGSNIQTWIQVDSSEQTPQNDNSNTQDSTISSQNDGKRYSTEFQEAYEFAKWNWITTMPTIQKANMEWKLTRIAMAKMLSQYAMNVLWQKPANIITPKFNDVTDKQNSDYDDWVTLAYQLWIMWQNMPWNNFRPNDEVTRAEFATALSRMAYWTSDWEYKWTAKYYIHHMEKLVREWIITNDDPNMKELRWYVMIMLMRSSK